MDTVGLSLTDTRENGVSIYEVSEVNIVRMNYSVPNISQHLAMWCATSVSKNLNKVLSHNRLKLEDTTTSS